MKQVAGRDAVFLYIGKDGASSTVLSCNILENPDGLPLRVSHEEMAEWALARIAVNDLFRSKLVRLPGDIGLPYWIHDPDFSIARHIQIHRPQDRDWVAVRAMLAELADAALDLTRPPWMMHVIPDVENLPDHDGLVSIVAFHFHHVAFDGITLGTMSATMFSDNEITEPGSFVGAGSRSRAALTGHELVRLPATAYRFVRAGVQNHRNSGKDETAAPAAPKRNWPVTRFNGAFRGPRTADLVSFPRDRVIELKACIDGVTVNDLMLSVVGEAVHRYLLAQGEPPAASLSSLAPVSTRSIRPGDTLNQFTFMVIDLHTQEPDLRRRLQTISEETTAAKARVATQFEDAPVGMVAVTPGPILRFLGYLNQRSKAKMTTPTNPPFNVVVSNVRTPDAKRKILGINVVRSFGIQPIATGTTLAHAVVNRLDKINISITVDGSAMPDIGEYCDCLRDSFRAHEAALDAVDFQDVVDL